MKISYKICSNEICVSLKIFNFSNGVRAKMESIEIFVVKSKHRAGKKFLLIDRSADESHEMFVLFAWCWSERVSVSLKIIFVIK